MRQAQERCLESLLVLAEAVRQGRDDQALRENASAALCGCALASAGGEERNRLGELAATISAGEYYVGGNPGRLSRTPAQRDGRGGVDLLRVVRFVAALAPATGEAVAAAQEHGRDEEGGPESSRRLVRRARELVAEILRLLELLEAEP